MVGRVEVQVEGWVRAVWEAASDAFALSDARGIVLAANPAYCALYGIGPKGAVGQSFAAILLEHERTAAELRYREIFQGPPDPAPFEAVVRRPDGTERTVESRVSFVEDAGQRVAMLSIVRDVTEEVVARRTAVRAEEERRAFLSSLSHDIKSPLSVIKGHAQVLRRHVVRQGDAPPVDRLVAGLSQIETSALQVAELVDELVEVSRLSTGDSPPLHVASTDLLALVRDVITKHERLADNHRLVLRTNAETVSGEWDPTRLERVLDNLLSNAIKYSPEGGTVTVSVGLGGGPRPVGGAGRAYTADVDQPDLRIGALLGVEDQGIGIASEDLPHVFERFRRGGNAAQHRIPGSGVGLASVREIVQQHGGTVSIESSEGQGTTVSVWLPLVQPAPSVAEGAA